MKHVAFLIFVTLLIGTSYTAHAIEYGGLGIFPNISEVDASDPLTQSWFIYTLEPGAVKKGKVNVVNTSDKTADVYLYPVDAVTTEDGAFAPESEDKVPTGVGAWTALGASESRLEPGEAKVVDFTIRVPGDAEVGDHMGAIIAQSGTSSDNPAGSGLRVTTRVGARMYVTVSGEMVKKLVFDDFVQETKDGEINFYTTFSNKGNIRIRLKGVIEITAGEKIIDLADIPEREVFPGKTITIPIEWRPEDLPGGRVKARAVVAYDTDSPLVREIVFSVSSFEVLLNPLMFASLSLFFVGALYLAGRRIKRIRILMN